MSYSRYLNSRFYTYPMDSDRGIVFCVDCEHEYTIEELKTDMDRCLDEACTLPDNPNNLGYGADLATLREELKGYMNQFLREYGKEEQHES